MVELADTRGLGPRGISSLAGSIPVLGTIYFKKGLMLKKIRSSMQEKLIKKNLCPGCTMTLKKCKNLKDITQDKKIVQCKCNRIYIWNVDTDTYRRATTDEEQHFLTK